MTGKGCRGERERERELLNIAAGSYRNKCLEKTVAERELRDIAGGSY